MTERILASCPYCKSEAYIKHVCEERYYVICQNNACDAMGPTKDTEDEARDAWNLIGYSSVIGMTSPSFKRMTKGEGWI